MIRINVPWILEFISSVDQLKAVKSGQKFDDIWMTVYSASKFIDDIYVNSVYRPHLRVSIPAASELGQELDQISSRLQKNSNYEISHGDEWKIQTLGDNFRAIFLAELSTMPVYLLSRKEAFDVELLVNSGVSLFPRELVSKAPETERDANEAGKALAFELATACGFHSFRVIESVVKRYWDIVSGGNPRPKLETLGSFAAEMDKNSIGDVKIIEALRQLTKLHRNPIIHPDVMLTTEEAIGIVGMVRSVVGAMLPALPDVEGEPSEVPVEAVPG